MRKKIYIVILILILLLCFPPKVFADQTNTIFYYDLQNGQTKLFQEKLNFHGDFPNSQIAFIIFDNLFCQQKMFIPQGSHLISARIENETLILNLSSQIKNYGGSYFEKHLLSQIKLTAQNLNFDHFSILIDNQKQYLPEGIDQL